MTYATIREMLECATERERHQFLAGAQKIIKLTENSLHKRRKKSLEPEGEENAHKS